MGENGRFECFCAFMFKIHKNMDVFHVFFAPHYIIMVEGLLEGDEEICILQNH